MSYSILLSLTMFTSSGHDTRHWIKKCLINKRIPLSHVFQKEFKKGTPFLMRAEMVAIFQNVGTKCLIFEKEGIFIFFIVKKTPVA